MRCRDPRLFLVAAIALLTSAHVGSPDTYYEGAAGPYPVRVIVRTPGVVPGLAQITVRLLGTSRVHRVLVLPVFWDPKTAAPPPPDVAAPVSGDSALYSAALWLMRTGAYSVQVTVEGPEGSGTTLVPVTAVATQRLALRTPLGILLLCLGALLFAGAITLISAAARESVLEPGRAPDSRDMHRARIAAVVGTLLLLLALLGGWAWWNAVDAAYRTGLFRPLHATATFRTIDRDQVLWLTIDDPAWVDPRHQRAPLIPDHGHLMHLFLVRDSGLAAFAHLHPVRRSMAMFETRPPPLPAGRYRVYAEIVHESGFAQTLVSTADLTTPPTRWRPSDPDDAWLVTAGKGEQGRGKGNATASLADGSIMTWQRGSTPVVVNQDARLEFAVSTPNGAPATLEPYMGMTGHLVLSRDDGAVFVHLHPAGTISLAAQEAFELRQPGDTIPGSLAKRLGERDEHRSVPFNPRAMASTGSTVSFPYAFPRPGNYRMWVQVKREGRILTGTFEVLVGEDS
jgi:hypothetical protein